MSNQHSQLDSNGIPSPPSAQCPVPSAFPPSLHHAFTASAHRTSAARFARDRNLSLDQLEQELSAPSVRTERALAQRLARYRAAALADESLSLAVATLTNLLIDYNAQRAADQNLDDESALYLAPDDPARIKPETARKAASLICRMTTSKHSPPLPTGGEDVEPKARQVRGLDSNDVAPLPSPLPQGARGRTPTSLPGRGRFAERSDSESGEGSSFYSTSFASSSTESARPQDRVLAPAASQDTDAEDSVEPKALTPTLSQRAREQEPRAPPLHIKSQAPPKPAHDH